MFITMKAFIALSSKILLKMTPMYTGKVLANSKEIQDIQSIPVGEIRYTSKFLCCSNMINLHLFFLPSFVISHECRSTLLANKRMTGSKCCKMIFLLYFFAGKNFTGGLPNNDNILIIILSSNSAVL